MPKRRYQGRLRTNYVRVAGHKVWVVNSDDPRLVGDTFGTFECSRRANKRPNVNKAVITLYGLKGRVWWETLWHELVHAFGCLNGPPDLTEKQTQVIERGFIRFCRDNPRLARRLVKEFTK